MHCDRALAEWAVKENVGKRFVNVHTSKMWLALAPEREHAQGVNVCRVLALLRTYCPGEAAVERAMSLRWRFTSSMHDLVETHAPSMCMALHSNLPPFKPMSKGTRSGSGTAFCSTV